MRIFEKQLTLNGEFLNDSALATAVVGWQGESLDAAASTDTAGQDVVGVQIITTLWRNIKIERSNIIHTTPIKVDLIDLPFILR